MTNEDDEKLYDYVEQIKKEYGTNEFFYKNGFFVDDEKWNGLYTYLVYDEVHVHQTNSEDDSFIKPIIKNIFTQVESSLL